MFWSFRWVTEALERLFLATVSAEADSEAIYVDRVRQIFQETNIQMR